MTDKPQMHDLRGYHQLPLFLSPKAIEVIRWARKIPAQIRSGRKVADPPGVFSWSELSDFLFGDAKPSGGVPKGHPVREATDYVKHELWAANMLDINYSWSHYRLRLDMCEVVPDEESGQVVGL